MGTTATPAAARSGGARDLLTRVRSAAGTTPGFLRVASIAVVGAMVLFALIASVGVSARRGSIDRTANRIEPLVVASQDAHSALVQADAAAAAAFLSGGVEDANQRTAYSRALEDATSHLQVASVTGSGSDAAQLAVREASEQVAVYAGLVERARANNRLGYPVGAAYLRTASDLMRDEVIPAVERVGTVGADAYSDEYADGRATNVVLIIGILVVLGVTLVLLVQLQRTLVAKTRRRLNPALAGATVIVVVAGIWTGVGLGVQAAALRDARFEAYETISVASKARTTAFDARADENLALIARGNGARFNDAFAAAATEMGTTNDGVLADLYRAADNERERSLALSAASGWTEYLEAHERVVELVAAGDQVGAVTASLTTSDSLFANVDASFGSLIQSNQLEFTQRVNSADAATTPLTAVAVVATILVAVLTMLGVAPRIAEYR